MSFPRYPSYKPSGVEWLGEVPAHWDVIRLKNVLQQRITDGPHTTPTFTTDGVPFLSVDGIQEGELQFDGCRYITEADHAEFRLKALPRRGDLLMGKAASTGKIARVKVDFEFSIWSPLALIRVEPALSNPTFFEQCLKSPIVQAQIDNFCTSNTQKNISMDDIPRLILTRPPLPEQTRIAEFLDRETAKIDELVAEQRRLMELLKEKRQATISHAVTKGLNSRATLHPSGSEWLGDIPQHWQHGPLKRFWEVIDCKHVTVPFLEEGIPVASVMEVRSFELDLSAALKTSNEFAMLLSEGGRRPIRGDVVYCRNTANTGTSAYVGTDEQIALGQDVCLIKSSGRNGRFLNYVLHSGFMVGQLDTLMVGSTFKRINVAEIRGLIVSCPPTSEQDQIVTYLDTETAKLDTLTAEAQRAIDLLQERRTALISAAVTGQIDVRNA